MIHVVSIKTNRDDYLHYFYYACNRYAINTEHGEGKMAAFFKTLADRNAAINRLAKKISSKILDEAADFDLSFYHEEEGE